ncbi:MAG: alanine racemase [Ilumatobacteraceae bacterium]
MATRRVGDLPTPALIVDERSFRSNLAVMAKTRPGLSLRPHVKAHKCTSLAREQERLGHRAFTCATPREVVGMARAGLGFDLLLANECLDPRRLADMAAVGDRARITVAVDSPETVTAAARAGLSEVLIDVNVGLPRCGCDPGEAGALADLARRSGLVVRGVMGYEGHLMALPDDESKGRLVRESMSLLTDALAAVGDDTECTVVSAGGTGTFHLFDGDDVLRRITEVQAGSYALMDTHYGSLGLPFSQALYVLGTVISSRHSWAVADVGLKALGMDHGNPAIPGATVWFCSDEHTTFAPDGGGRVRTGDKVLVVPAHVDPTVAMHETMYLVSSTDADGTVLDQWPVDLRGWSTGSA